MLFPCCFDDSKIARLQAFWYGSMVAKVRFGAGFRSYPDIVPMVMHTRSQIYQTG